jgi:alpha-mannosidase
VLRVRFAADGSIASLWDKRLQRELITPGQSGNRLAVYVDDGDVWDFPTDYAEQEPRQLELTGAEAGVDGSRAVVRQQYRLGPTRLEQQVVLMAGGARLDFHTTARWREPRAMLRTSFPVTPQAEDATFEIQFGSIRRPTHSNTSWDLARTEVAAHKWADLSQGDMGVALLNDGKYGHRIKDGVIDLNLLRSVKYVAEVVAEGTAVAGDEPDDRFTDQTDHEFTYSLYPHEGDHVAGRVIEAAYELNVPLRATLLEAGAGDGPAAGEGPARVARGLPPAAGFLRVEPSTVMVEAVKLAEDGDDLVLRLYETSRRGVVAQVHLGFTVMAAAEVDLLEEHPAPLDVEDDGLLTLVFLPFEIKTVRVTPMAADRG